MNTALDIYNGGAADEVLAALQLTLNEASRNGAISDDAVRHLEIASRALDAEMTKRRRSAFSQSHGALNALQLARAKAILLENACENNASKLAAEACSISDGHFSRGFKMSMGKSPHRWVIECRLEKAKHLLLNTTFSLADVADHCGYTGKCHFTRIFTREVGISPGAWRRVLSRFSTPGTEKQRA